EEVYELTKIDRWFLRNMQQIVEESRQAGTIGNAPGGIPGASANAPASAARGLPESSAQAPAAAEPDRNTGFQPVSSRKLPACSIPFRGFDPYGELLQRRRNLPHREEPQATYCGTFRIADSCPQKLLRDWREDQDTWLKFHPKPLDWKTERE